MQRWQAYPTAAVSFINKPATVGTLLWILLIESPHARGPCLASQALLYAQPFDSLCWGLYACAPHSWLVFPHCQGLDIAPSPFLPLPALTWAPSFLPTFSPLCLHCPLFLSFHLSAPAQSHAALPLHLHPGFSSISLNLTEPLCLASSCLSVSMGFPLVSLAPSQPPFLSLPLHFHADPWSSPGPCLFASCPHPAPFSGIFPNLPS